MKKWIAEAYILLWEEAADPVHVGGRAEVLPTRWSATSRRHQDCLEKLSAKPCDILIVDLEDCEAEGLELLTQARRMAPWISTMAIVERAAVPTAVKAVKAGACECLEKPVSRSIACARRSRDNWPGWRPCPARAGL